MRRHHGAQLVDDGEDGVAARVSVLGVHVLDDALPQERYRVVLLLRGKQMLQSNSVLNTSLHAVWGIRDGLTRDYFKTS